MAGRVLLHLLLVAASAALVVHGRTTTAAPWMRAVARDACLHGTVEECLAGGYYYDVAEARGGGQRRRLFLDGGGVYGAAPPTPTMQQYISYAALLRNSVPCSLPGASYYNCRPGAEANPYTRGCSAITQCRD
ncbi:hypothetical protein ABZP36_018246 [Zizania latifolia]